MSVPQGNFDCAALMTVQVRIEQIWGDSQANTIPFIAEVSALNTIIANQTATFAPLTGKQDKDNEMSIVWMADCTPSTPDDCTDFCTVGGPEIESDCKRVSINECYKDGFSITEEKFRTSIYSREEVVARQLLMKMKAMDEYLVGLALAKFITFKGVNQYTRKPGVIDGNDTYIAPSYLDANIMGYFINAAKKNRMSMPYFLSGEMLSTQQWQYAMEAANAQNGQANQRKINSIPIVNDLWNVDDAIGAEGMIMINKPAIAFVTKHRYDATPKEYYDMMVYSIPSKNIPGLVYDVVYNNECVNSNDSKRDFKHNWSLYAMWDGFLNPLACNTDMTGLLTFLCGTPE